MIDTANKKGNSIKFKKKKGIKFNQLGSSVRFNYLPEILKLSGIKSGYFHIIIQVKVIIIRLYLFNFF